METTFEYAGSSNAVTSNVADTSKTYDALQKAALGQATIDTSKQQIVTSELKNKALAEQELLKKQAQIEKDKAEIQKAQDAIIAQEDASRFRAEASNLSGIQKRDYYDTKRKEIIDAFGKGTKSEKYTTVFQDQTQSDYNSAINEAQKETDDKAVNFLSLALQDKTANKDALIVSLTNSGVSKEAIDNGVLKASIIVADKQKETIISSLQGADYTALKTTMIPEATNAIQEQIKSVYNTAIAQGKNPDIDPEIQKLVKDLQGTQKEFSEMISLSASNVISKEKLNGHTNEIAWDVFKDAYKTEGEALTAMTDYMKTSSVKALSREMLANPDAYSPSLKEMQKKEDTDYAKAEATGSYMKLDYAIKKGDMQGATLILARNALTAQTYGKDLLDQMIVLQDTLTEDPKQVAIVGAKYNSLIDTFTAIRNTTNGDVALKNMLGDKYTDIENIIVIKQNITNGDGFKAKEKLEQYNKAPVKKPLSGEVNQHITATLAKDDYASLRAYKDEHYKALSMLNTMLPDDITKEGVTAYFDRLKEKDIVNLDGVSIHFGGGRVFDREVDSYIVAEIKKAQPDVKYVQYDKDVTTIIKKDGSRVLYNSQTLFNKEISRGLAAEKADYTITERASDTGALAVQKVYTTTANVVGTVATAGASPWIAAVERGMAKDAETIEKLKVYLKDKTPEEIGILAKELRKESTIYNLPEAAVKGMPLNIYEIYKHVNDIKKQDTINLAKKIEETVGVNKERDKLYRQNPMNIKAEGTELKGFLGVDKDFAVFDSPKSSILAGIALVDKKIKQNTTLTDVLKENLGREPMELELRTFEATVKMKRDTKLTRNNLYHIARSLLIYHSDDEDYTETYNEVFKDYVNATKK